MAPEPRLSIWLVRKWNGGQQVRCERFQLDELVLKPATLVLPPVLSEGDAPILPRYSTHIADLGVDGCLDDFDEQELEIREPLHHQLEQLPPCD